MRVMWNEIAATQLSITNGATVVIADHGAHVLSWKPTGKKDVFFISRCSWYQAGNAIRGGVPVIFPQFAAMGSGLRHGFARLHNWQLCEEGNSSNGAHAIYRLTQQNLPDQAWSHSFELIYTVTLEENLLDLSLTVSNTSDHDWDFQAALHTYFQVPDATACSLNGLDTVSFLDQVDGGSRKVQKGDCVQFRGEEVDRIYLNTSRDLRLKCIKHSMRIRQEGFQDTVVWNPGPTKAKSLIDLASDEWKQFVCVEAAQVANPIVLSSGECWTGKQIFSLIPPVESP